MSGLTSIEFWLEKWCSPIVRCGKGKGGVQRLGNLPFPDRDVDGSVHGFVALAHKRSHDKAHERLIEEQRLRMISPAPPSWRP